MNAAVLERTLPSRWRPALMVLGFGLIGLWLGYGPTFASMAATWERSQTFAHGWLVLPVFAWLVWRLRRPLAALRPAPQPLWLLPMVACALLWLLGDLARAYAATQLAATGLLVLLVPAVLGTRVAGAMLYPLAFLFFMVPVGDFMLPTLMEWTADVTVFGIRLLGVPVYRDGLQFVIPSGTWSVVEACSGARYLLASFMVGTLFGYLNYRSARRRWLFAGVAIVVPIVANWLRAIMIVMLGHLTDNKVAAGVDHLIYGWIFFGVVVLLMFWIGAWWSEAPASIAARLEPGEGDAAAPGGRLWAATGLGLALVLALPHTTTWHLHGDRPSGPALALPALEGAGEDPSSLYYEPTFADPDGRSLRHYSVDGRTFGVHVAHYRRQDYTRKLVSSANALVPPESREWFRVTGDVRTLPIDGTAVPVRHAELRQGDLNRSSSRRLLVRQLLWVDGRFTASDVQAVALAVRGQLAGRGDDSIALTIFTDATADPDAAARAIDRFTQRHLRALGRWLQRSLHAEALPAS